MQLVERATSDFEKPGELSVRPAAETLGDVPTHRVGRIFGLALRAKISGETRLGRQPEYLDAYLFGELPDNQLRVMVSRRHAIHESMPRAALSHENSSQFAWTA